MAFLWKRALRRGGGGRVQVETGLHEVASSVGDAAAALLGRRPPCQNYMNLITVSELEQLLASFYDCDSQESITRVHDELKKHKDALSALMVNLRQASTDLTKAVAALKNRWSSLRCTRRSASARWQRRRREGAHGRGGPQVSSTSRLPARTARPFPLTRLPQALPPATRSPWITPRSCASARTTRCSRRPTPPRSSARVS